MKEQIKIEQFWAPAGPLLPHYCFRVWTSCPNRRRFQWICMSIHQIIFSWDRWGKYHVCGVSKLSEGLKHEVRKILEWFARWFKSQEHVAQRYRCSPSKDYKASKAVYLEGGAKVPFIRPCRIMKAVCFITMSHWYHSAIVISVWKKPNSRFQYRRLGPWLSKRKLHGAWKGRRFVFTNSCWRTLVTRIILIILFHIWITRSICVYEMFWLQQCITFIKVIVWMGMRRTDVAWPILPMRAWQNKPEEL